MKIVHTITLADYSNYFGLFSVQKNRLYDSKMNELGSLFSPMRIDGMTILLCKRGTGSLTVNLKEHQLSAQQILVILPNHLIQMGELSADFWVEVVVFSLEFTTIFSQHRKDNLPVIMFTAPLLALQELEVEELIEVHSLIQKHQNSQDSSFNLEIKNGLLYSFLSLIARAYLLRSQVDEVPHGTQKEHLTRTFFRHLKDHKQTKQSVLFYADLMAITPKYLTTTIKAVTGKPPLVWINDFVIIEAKILLKMSNLTVSQIAEKLNFPNASFMGQLFKKQTGMTPLEFRIG